MNIEASVTEATKYITEATKDQAEYPVKQPKIKLKNRVSETRGGVA